jgi:hypothetical protein
MKAWTALSTKNASGKVMEAAQSNAGAQNMRDVPGFLLLAGGLGIQCKYLTARGTSTAQYIHSDSGIIGLTSCPILRKSEVVVDNGCCALPARKRSTGSCRTVSLLSSA